MSDGAVHRFATVVPIYRPTLSSSEKQRLIRTLKNVPADSCFFVGPESLRGRLSDPALRLIPFVGFQDRHFGSVGTYNSWILQPELYRCFSRFTFVIICQLDAVIVRPLPIDFNWDFDFLGAPWVPPWKIWWNPITKRLSRTGPRRLQRTLHVGNGGLSIRRTDVFRSLKRVPKFRRMPNEDIIISYFHRRLGIKIASPELAEKFFMETGARQWAPGTPVPSVYGFHALNKFNPRLEVAIIGENSSEAPD